MLTWPEQPSPGQLVRLPLRLPPVLVAAAGYTGSARYLALYWTPFGDELMYADGTVSATGWWPAWTTLTQHRIGLAVLGPYELGTSDSEARHWLLADRWEQTLDVGLALDVQQLLATQPSEMSAATEVLGAERIRELLETQLQEPRVPDIKEVQRQMQDANQQVAELRAWLDERLHELGNTTDD